ncbi:MAG: TMEM175 family protein [Lacibacter sp.]
MISTNRIEAFSDGVIAILITIMVFDLKLPENVSGITGIGMFKPLIPKLLSYATSFLVLAIMWVNHHQLFHQVKKSDRKLLWHNIHLLFWMSLIPFATNFMGSNPFLAESTLLYGLVFFMCALSFSFLRSYIVKKGLLYETISKTAQNKILRKNMIAFMLYLSAAFLGYLSVYISFILFLIVPAMYFIPEKIIHEKND